METPTQQSAQAEPATQQDPEALKWQKGSEFLKDRFPGNGFLRLTDADDLDRQFYIKVSEIVCIEQGEGGYTQIVVNGSYHAVCESPKDVIRLMDLCWRREMDRLCAEEQDPALAQPVPTKPAPSALAQALTALGADQATKAVSDAVQKFEANPDATDALLGFLNLVHDYLGGVIDAGELLDLDAGEIQHSRELLRKFAAGLGSLSLAVTTAKALDLGLRNLAERLLVTGARTLHHAALLQHCAYGLNDLARDAEFGARARALLLTEREWLALKPQVSKADPRWPDVLRNDDPVARAVGFAELKRPEPEATPQPVQPEVAAPHVVAGLDAQELIDQRETIVQLNRDLAEARAALKQALERAKPVQQELDPSVFGPAVPLSLPLYRPSNQSELDVFESQRCAACAKSDDCDIPLRSMAHRIDDPEYPHEWVFFEERPFCKAYVDRREFKVA